MAAALCVAVLTLCGATLPTDLNTERDRLGDLPTSLRESIFLRLTGAASFASLYGSCRGLKHDTAGAMNVRRLLQAPHTVTDLDLPARIDEWAASIISQDPLVRVLHSQILTPQAALGLYDRLLNSSLNETEIARLLNILIRNVDRDVFVGVVSGFGMPTEKAHEVTFLLTDLNLGDRPVGVPQVVLDQIQALLDTQLRLAPHPEDPKIEAVRQRYPPPFDAVFPRNHVVVNGLLDVVHDQLEAAVTADDEVLVLREALRDPQVLQALLRHGIRFDFQYLWCIDLSMDSFMDVYALLAPVSPEYPFDDLLPLLLAKRYDLMEALMRTPSFLRRAEKNPVALVGVLACAVLNQDTDLFRRLVRLPVMSVIAYVPCESEGKTLLEHAKNFQCQEIVDVLSHYMRAVSWQNVGLDDPIC